MNKHTEKPIYTTMGHLHMRRKGIQSTRKKPPYTDLDDKCNTGVVLCTAVEPSTTKEGKF